jgi:hypothetical protein
MRYEDIPKLATWLLDSNIFASVGSTNRVAALRAAWGTAAGPATAASAPPARRGLLRIDDLIADYAEVFSPMAKTNLLTELERAIIDWHTARPGPLPVPMAALKAVVGRKLSLRDRASRYNRAICIGYNIYCNYDKTNHHVHPNSTLNTNYYRHSDNDANDMETKCRNLWNAIVAAHGAVSNLPIATHPLAERERTLKIFMAPEFYFRGRNGAYSPDIVSSIIPRMRALGTANGTYKDWLFVFGTAVAAIETQVTYCPTCGYNNSTIRYDRDPLNPAKTIAKCSLNPAHVPTTGNWGAEVQNVALIQHGGDTHLVAKEYVSGIDYRNAPKILPTDPDRPTVRMPGGNYLDVSSPQGSRDAYHRRGPAAPIKTDERMGGCIFSIDGITIGLEVCLDHALGTVAAPYGRASAYAGTIQILLIPSYGMSIGTGMHCKPGGIAFNVDGRIVGSSEVKLNLPGAPVQAETQVAAAPGSLSLFGPFNIPA